MSVQNLTPVVDSTQVAAQTTTPNPTDNTIMSDTPAPDVPANDQEVTGTSSPDAQAETAVDVLDPAKKQELEEKFLTLINTPRYWANPNRIKRLEEALVLPEYDDPSMRMFYDSASDELVLAEYNKSRTEKRPANEITIEQIKELAEFKYHQKYVVEPMLKEQRAAERESRKYNRKSRVA